MAKYDIPAMLKFALATSGQPDLFYIGHSQGTLLSFACFSRDPQLAKKVRYIYISLHYTSKIFFLFLIASLLAYMTFRYTHSRKLANLLAKFRACKVLCGKFASKSSDSRKSSA